MSQVLKGNTHGTLEERKGSHYDCYKGADCRRLGDEDGGQFIILINQYRNLGFLSSETEVIGGFHASSSLYYCRIIENINGILDLFVPLTGLRQGFRIVEI